MINNKDFIIKVDRVSTAAEAIELQDLGVNIIGVSMNDNPIYADNRMLDVTSVSQITNELELSKLAIEVPSNYFDILGLVEKIVPDYIQISGTDLLHVEVVKNLKSKGIGVIYSGIEASYEDDPYWILSRYIEKRELDVSFYQIDLLGDIKNSWEFFKSESPNYPEELQISDIVKIGEQFPVIISLDFSQKNILEIIKSFPSIKGVCLSLSKKPNREDIHCFDYQSVLNVLEVLKRQSP